MPTQTRRELICQNVVDILREERTNRGISMKGLARMSGVTQPMISYLERYLRNPTLDLLLRLTEALDVDLTQILKRATKRADKLD